MRPFAVGMKTAYHYIVLHYDIAMPQGQRLLIAGDVIYGNLYNNFAALEWYSPWSILRLRSVESIYGTVD